MRKTRPTMIKKHMKQARREAMKDVKAKLVEIEFRDAQGEANPTHLQVPLDITREQLEQVLQSVNESKEEEEVSYSFFVKDERINSTLKDCLDRGLEEFMEGELIVPVTYEPEAVFRVRAVSRCTSSLPGHSEPILFVTFSPDGRYLASGSGDSTIRVWDVLTEMPKITLRGHKDWIQAIAWSPDGTRLASGSKDTHIRLWDPETGIQKPKKPLRGHSNYISSLSWEPLHLSGDSPACVASGSKDGTIKIWSSARGDRVASLSGHSKGVTAVIWGGSGLLYSASQDRTIKVWVPKEGKLVRTLSGHAHWVNNLSLNTEYVLRMGPFKPNNRGEIIKVDPEQRYREVTKGKPETLVSCSEDFTVMVWNPEVDKQPVERMVGHQQPVLVVKFSPDGNYIATASFDKGIKLWNARTYKFIGNFRGHVGPIYQMAWSSDSRLLVTGSRDSTLKVWDVATCSLKLELPGHADEIYAADWSLDGRRVASGGKDKILKFWRR